MLELIVENCWNVFLVLVIALVYSWWKLPNRKFPPGVRGYPIVGALLYFGNYPEKVIAEWSRKKYGSIMSVRLGRKDIVYINSYDMLSKALLNNSSNYLDRPDMPVMNVVFQLRGFTFRPADAEWKAQRNFARSKFSRFGIGSTDMELRINPIIEDLLFLIEEENGKPFRISEHFAWTFGANIIAFCFGRKLDRYDKRMLKLLDHIYHLFSDANTSQTISMLLIFPGLRMLPRFKEAANEFYRRSFEMLKFMDEEISRKKELVRNEEVTDYEEAFFKEMELRNEADGFTSEQLRVAVFEFIFAGTETSSLSLSWGILCLLHYPDTQKKLQEEIHAVLERSQVLHKIVVDTYFVFNKYPLTIGEDETPSLSHKDSLPYTMAFIQELYRFRTVAPFSNQRMTKKTVQLGNYIIPKNTTVVPNLWAIHNDPDLWVEPEVFKPERHLDEDGKFIYSNKVIPFSIGGRSCPAEKFARMEIFLIWVNLLKNFEFSPDPECKDLPEINGGVNGFVFSPFPFKVVANKLKN